MNIQQLAEIESDLKALLKKVHDFLHPKDGGVITLDDSGPNPPPPKDPPPPPPNNS